MLGNARHLDPADGELYRFREQNLGACTCAVGLVDKLRLVQKDMQEENSSVRAESAITDWHCFPSSFCTFNGRAGDDRGGGKQKADGINFSCEAMW